MLKGPLPGKLLLEREEACCLNNRACLLMGCTPVEVVFRMTYVKLVAVPGCNTGVSHQAGLIPSVSSCSVAMRSHMAMVRVVQEMQRQLLSFPQETGAHLT